MYKLNKKYKDRWYQDSKKAIAMTDSIKDEDLKYIFENQGENDFVLKTKKNK